MIRSSAARALPEQQYKSINPVEVEDKAKAVVAAAIERSIGHPFSAALELTLSSSVLACALPIVLSLLYDNHREAPAPAPHLQPILASLEGSGDEKDDNLTGQSLDKLVDPKTLRNKSTWKAVLHEGQISTQGVEVQVSTESTSRIREGKCTWWQEDHEFCSNSRAIIFSCARITWRNSGLALTSRTFESKA